MIKEGKEEIIIEARKEIIRDLITLNRTVMITIKERMIKDQDQGQAQFHQSHLVHHSFQSDF
jgi:hypothetical protein